MRAGTFTLGDFSLFVYLLQSMGDLTTFAGMLAARYKQLDVSVQRMYRLMENATGCAGPTQPRGLERSAARSDIADQESVRPPGRAGCEQSDIPLSQFDERHRGREPAPQTRHPDCGHRSDRFG